jgi:D-serine deaminase-like pyridoxal phosphate-dependent protein
MNLAEVPTPAFLIDRAKFVRNCDRMIKRCRELGAPLRPHMKTMKSIDAARIAIDPGHGGIAVSTLREAEYFAGHGIDDVQLAICLTPDKLPRAAAVARRAPQFSFFLDDLATARAVGDFAAHEDMPFNIWIEIDSGEHRTGLLPDSELLPEIASVLARSPVRLAGVATHGGHSYSARGEAALAAVAEEERVAVTRAAERLRAAGYTVPGVSAGSTPTAMFGKSGEGLTEIRAGVYMAGDLFQAGIGAQAEEEIAGSVLATVISQKPEANQIVVDAGGLALSKDRATAAVEGGDFGYGLVLDLDGEPSFGRLFVGGVHQEHGEIRGETPLPFDRLPVGSRVRILPNHVCMTAAAYDRCLIVDEGEVAASWDRVNGW